MTAFTGTHDGSRQRPRSSPAAINPVVKHWGRYPDFGGPIDNTKTLSVVLKNNIAAVVSGLLLGSCPLAIAWLVAAVVVLPVELQAWFIASLNVGNELVNIHPALANHNAAASVAWVALVIGVGAATNHRFPHLEQWVFPLAVLGDSFLVKAAATLRLLAPQGGDANVSGRATARALDSSELRVSAFFFEDAKNCVPPIHVARRNDFGSRLDHRHPTIR